MTMKKFLFIGCLFLSLFQSYAQGIKLTNALIIGQFDKQEDRFAIEVNVTDLFTSLGIKAIPSINILKQGADPLILASDTMINALKLKGIDTYVLIYVKGYDRKFKGSNSELLLEEGLKQSSIYSLFKDDITSITFEFSIFKGGKRVYANVFKVGNISNRDDVIKRFRKKAPKFISTNFVSK